MEALSSYAVTLIERFRTKGVLVDTNLLLLYAVGKYDETLIANQSFSRLEMYTPQDFGLLRSLMELFTVRVTTSYVLAEVSNWLGYLPEQHERASLRLFADTFRPFPELNFASVDIARHPRFAYLGLTDTAIATVADRYLVVSDDARFIWHLNQLGLEALNINHLRQEAWLDT